MGKVNNLFKSRPLPTLMLQLGLAFVFLYAAVSSFMHPLEWIGYLPTFIVERSTTNLPIYIMGIYEITLGLWLLSGIYRKYVALLTVATLAGIIVVDFNELIITFRDVGLLFAALALFFEK